MRILNTVVFFLIFNVFLGPSAWARPSCAELIEFFKVSSNHELESFEPLHDIINSISVAEPSVENFLGKPVSFEDVVGFISSKVPERQRPAFVIQTAKAFSEAKFNLSDKRGPPDVKARYKNRFTNISIDRFKSSTILWTTQVIYSQSEFLTLVDRTIDLIAESSFIPTRRASILVQPRRTFTSNNIETIKDKILLKMFTLGETAEFEPTSKTKILYDRVRNVLSGFLPMQFSELKRAQLTQEYMDIYQEEGPQALYKIIRQRYGVGLSIKYWLTHLTNAKMALFTVFAAFMAPQTLQTYEFIVNEQSIQAEDPSELATGEKLLKAMRTPPELLVTEIKEHLSELPETDAQYIAKFLEEVGIDDLSEPNE